MNIPAKANVSFPLFWSFLRKHPLRYWFYLFFFINLAFGMSGASNAGIRFATLCAMVEDHSFQIDPYVPLSVDWSRTPDGHYYSSKAPGPVLLAFPLFWTLDKLVTLGTSTREERDHRRLKNGRGVTMPVICFFLLALPFAFWIFRWITLLELNGVSLEAIRWFAIASLFANTASFFMNSLFTHGLIATLLLAMGWALLEREFLWLGFLFGWAVLSDYSTGPLVFPLVFALWFLEKNTPLLKQLFRFGCGGLLPFLLFLTYNQICFGSPFSLPYRYVNPEFTQTLSPDNSLWGVLAFLPDFSVFFQFFFGLSRGFLWTQPWLLLSWGVVFKNPRKDPALFALQIFFGGSLPILMWLFASYGPWWHGGDSPGPRFICAVFPAWALLTALAFDGLAPAFKKALNLLLLPALLLYIAVFSAMLFPSDAGPIWGWYGRYWMTLANGFSLLRLAVLLGGFTLTYRVTRQNPTFPIKTAK